MSANVETMFSVRETPWHGLGEIVEEALSSAEALEKAGLNWMVIQESLYDSRQIKLPIVGNFRNTDHKFLGAVSEQYQIVQNTEAFDFTDSLLGQGVRYETAGSLASGKRIWMLAKMPETMLCGDKVVPYLVFTNSHDGKGSIRVACTPVRVVCQNTLNLALKQATRSWSTIHKGNMEYKLAEAKRTLELAERYMGELETKAVELANKTVTDAMFEDFTKALFPIPESAYGNMKQQDNILAKRDALKIRYLNAPDLADFRGNAWGVMNAVSDMATHEPSKRETVNGKENRFMNTIEGNSVIDEAYKILTSMVAVEI